MASRPPQAATTPDAQGKASLALSLFLAFKAGYDAGSQIQQEQAR